MEVRYTTDIAEIDYADRQYTPVGPADPDAAAVASDTIVNWDGCGGLVEISNESMSFMTPLGMANLNFLNTGGAGDPFIAAPYLRQWERGNNELVSESTTWNQVVVLDEDVRSTFGPARWEPVINGSAPNLASVRRMQQGFNPNTAIEISDGRITVFAVPTIALEDRGAVTYEGNLPMQQVVGATLQQQGDRWLVDEIVMANNGVFLQSQSDAWWWDASFDEPAASWTQPISFNVCPEDAEVNVYASGTEHAVMIRVLTFFWCD